jgi:hypothetical protein
MPTSAWNIPDNSKSISILRSPNNPAFTPTPPIDVGIANIAIPEKISWVHLSVSAANTVAFAIT